MGGNGAGGGSVKNQFPSTDVWHFSNLSQAVYV